MLSNVQIATGGGGAAASASTVTGGVGAGTKAKNRCTTCRAKLGLLPFQCRCGHAFCASHIASVAHACTFDYRAHQAKLLSEQLDTRGLHEKVEKI